MLKTKNNISEHILNRISEETFNIIICDQNLVITEISEKAQKILHLKINDSMQEVLEPDTCQKIFKAKDNNAHTKFTDFVDNKNYEFDVSYFEDKIIFILTKSVDNDSKMSSVALLASHQIKQYAMANSAFVESAKQGSCTVEDYAMEEFNRFKLIEFNSKLAQLHKISNNHLIMECGNLTEMLEKLVEKVKANVTNINITLETMQPIICDFNEYQFSTAILYLIGNVFEHCGYETPIKISLCEKNESIRIFIKDNGKGIEQSQGHRLFDVQEVHSIREINNVNLGLPVVKKIISEHGGTVFLTSTTEGTEISLTFPKTLSHDSLLNAEIKYTHDQEIDQIIKSMQYKRP